MSFSEMLFYGGITAVAVSLGLAVVAIVIYKIRASRLKRLLDSEYGRQSVKTAVK